MWLLRKHEKDYVMVMRLDGSWQKCEVQWECGRPYCIRYNDLLRLARKGNFDGICGNSWVVKWEPASRLMEQYFEGSE